MEMPVKKFLMIHYDGNITNDECPKCGGIICAGIKNIKWCENPECIWSNETETEIWLIHQKEKKND